MTRTTMPGGWLAGCALMGALLVSTGCSGDSSGTASFCDTAAYPPTGLQENEDWRDELVDAAPSEIRDDVVLVWASTDEEAGQVPAGSDEYQAAEQRLNSFLADECGWVDGDPPAEGE